MESESKKVKQPKELTLEQKKIVSSHGLNANDWMLDKETEFYFYLINKEGKIRRTIDKFMRGGKNGDSLRS